MSERIERASLIIAPPNIDVKITAITVSASGTGIQTPIEDAALNSDPIAAIDPVNHSGTGSGGMIENTLPISALTAAMNHWMITAATAAHDEPPTAETQPTTRCAQAGRYSSVRPPVEDHETQRNAPDQRPNDFNHAHVKVPLSDPMSILKPKAQPNCLTTFIPP